MYLEKPHNIVSDLAEIRKECATKNGHFSLIYTKCAFVKFFVKKDVYKG